MNMLTKYLSKNFLLRQEDDKYVMKIIGGFRFQFRRKWKRIKLLCKEWLDFSGNSDITRQAQLEAIRTVDCWLTTPTPSARRFKPQDLKISQEGQR
jgi:hypothetical protein